MNCDNLTDQELVQKSLENSKFFRCFVEAYEQSLRRYILRITGYSAADVDDVLQEVFITIFKNLNSYNPDLKLKSWVYRITHNKAIDCLRKKNRLIRSKNEIIQLEEDDQHILEQFNKISPELKLSLKEDLHGVIAIINQLPEEQRSVLILSLWEDKSYQEISDILKIPIGSVGSHINRARKLINQRVRIKK